MEQQSNNHLLLATKLTIPPVRPDLVPRLRLFQKLETCMEYPLTLIAAPAGFGKTTSLSTWATPKKHSVGWISLDIYDNDPVQFWTYVLTALGTLRADIGAAPLSLLQSTQPASIETVLIALINAFDGMQEHIALILDDYYVIEELSIHRAMTFLLDHLPPQLHLLIASRVDPPLPLSRLRARHQLLELRADDLRFTNDETAAFLNKIMGFQLTEHDIAALETRTEGWIAGLQLAALSMQGRKDIAGFISAFAGSHRYIVDYLTEEVLHRQSEQVRTFLLQTSILERMSGSLCDAVTGQSGSQDILEQLEQANLFLLPLDDERSWYRYHHLFAEALRFRLTQAHPDLLPILHERASIWFERHGFIPEAVNHALAGHAFERAATLIEPILYQMFNYGTHATVRHWLEALPEDVLYARPSLCLLYAWAFLYVGQIESCKRPLEVAERVWKAEGNLSRLGEVYIFQSSIALVQGDATHSQNYAQKALPLLSDQDLISRCNFATYMGASHLLLGNIREASILLDDALNQCQSVHLYGTLYAMNFVAEMQMVQGKLRQAAVTSQGIIDRLAGHASIHSSRAFSRLSRLSRQWNMLDQAIHQMQQAISLGEQAGQELYMSPIYLASAQVLWSRGELRTALDVLAKAELAAQRLGNSHAFEQVRTFQVQMELSQGKLAYAELWSKEADIEISDEPVYEHQTSYLMLARLRIAQHKTGEAVELLERLLVLDEEAGRTGNTIFVLALLSLAYSELGMTDQAISTLTRLLALTEPEGYVRAFVDEGPSMQALLATWLASPTQQNGSKGTSASAEYVRKLLAAFPATEVHHSRSSENTAREKTLPSQSPLLEPLTAREQDVLALLAEGLSNAEIAVRLVVTVGTVAASWYNSILPEYPYVA